MVGGVACTGLFMDGPADAVEDDAAKDCAAVIERAGGLSSLNTSSKISSSSSSSPLAFLRRLGQIADAHAGINHDGHSAAARAAS